MTENDLMVLFTGSYQLSQAVSYLAEIMDNGIINANFLKENKSIVKFEVRSRHINRKTYKCYIEYALNTIGKAGILHYTCECANGLRTVGCCSHVASITPIGQYLLNYMTKSCIKIIISNYVDTFTKIDVKVLTFYKILIIVCSIIFEIVLW